MLKGQKIKTSPDQFCAKAHHDTHIFGRYSSGMCKECQRLYNLAVTEKKRSSLKPTKLDYQKKCENCQIQIKFKVEGDMKQFIGAKAQSRMYLQDDNQWHYYCSYKCAKIKFNVSSEEVDLKLIDLNFVFEEELEFPREELGQIESVED